MMHQRRSPGNIWLAALFAIMLVALDSGQVTADGLMNRIYGQVVDAASGKPIDWVPLNVSGNISGLLWTGVSMVNPATGYGGTYNTWHILPTNLSGELITVTTINDSVSGFTGVGTSVAEEDGITRIDVYVTDTQAPNISSVNVSPRDPVSGVSTTFTATAVDNSQIDSVWARVTLPNGTALSPVYLTNVTAEMFSVEFTQTLLVGGYSAAFWANDTTGYTVSCGGGSLACNGSLNVTGSATHEESFNLSSGALRTVNGSSLGLFIQLTVNETVSDANLSLRVLKEDSLLSNLNVVNVRKTVSVNGSENLIAATQSCYMRVYYTGHELSENGLGEDDLHLFWRDESSSRWQVLNASNMSWVFDTGVNKTEDYVYANVTRFGVYALGSPSAPVPRYISLIDDWNLFSIPYLTET